VALRSDPKRLTLAFRQRQVRRAALISALVSIYFRKKVAIDDPDAVERWLALMVPKVLEQHDLAAQDAVHFGDTLRELEIGHDVPFKFEPVRSLTEEQLRASLRAVGVTPFLKKQGNIRALDDKFYTPNDKVALINEANQVASERVAAAVARHTQNGARRTLEEGARNDPMTIGFVRVTKANPCFFCAMLASRGLDGGLYAEDSFDLSDPRFIGSGTAKVHDGCGCSIKPVYKRSDEILADNKKYEDMWREFSGDGDADMLTNFRRHYEGRA
jgi:hypothetical protein